MTEFNYVRIHQKEVNIIVKIIGVKTEWQIRPVWKMDDKTVKIGFAGWVTGYKNLALYMEIAPKQAG